MRLMQLRYFCEVCRCGNVTRASEKLHVSQPSVSVGIKELEEEYGLSFFHRKKKQMILTEEGNFFFRRASEILDMIDSLDQHMYQLSLKTAPLLIGIPPMAGVFLLPSITIPFYERYPHIKIEMHESGSIDAEQMLESEKLDLAIAVLGERTNEIFNILPLAESQLLFCVNSKHHLAQHKSIRIAELKDEQIALMPSGTYRSTTLIHQQFDEAGLTPNTLLYSNQVELIRQYIDLGIGAFFMEQLLHDDDNIIGIPLDPPIYLKIGIIWKKGKRLRHEVSTFLSFVAEINNSSSFF